MDISDAYIVVGLVALILGLVIVHPALVLAVIGYAAFTHGLNRSR